MAVEHDNMLGSSCTELLLHSALTKSTSFLVLFFFSFYFLKVFLGKVLL